MKHFWMILFFIFQLPQTAKALAPPHLFSVATGCFDIMREKHRSFEFELEYKFLLNFFSSPLSFLEFRPLVGIMSNATASVYVYTGLNFDFLFWDRLLIAPGFAAGYYSQGHGKNLGYPLEFRSGIEIACQFFDGHRLGVHFYHLSNASLGHRNPGEESLVFYYDIPIKKGFFLINKTKH